jgi:hypothetical protein
MKVVLLLLCILFVLPAFFSHLLAEQSTTVDNPQPASVSAVIVTNGWMVNDFVLNDLGTVAFAGGQTSSSNGLFIRALKSISEIRRSR